MTIAETALQAVSRTPVKVEAVTGLMLKHSLQEVMALRLLGGMPITTSPIATSIPLLMESLEDMVVEEV